MPEDRLELRAPARPDEIGPLRRAVASFARERGACPETTEAVRLSVSEALANVVLHAYRDREDPGDVVTVAWREDGELVVVVCDEGLGPRPRGDTPGLGLGIGLMAESADAFTIASRKDGCGTVVSLRFDLAAGARAIA